MWLDRVKKVYGDNLEITWKHVVLEQVNSKEGPDWKVWEQPEEYESRGLLALRAGEAARLQGREAFERFHLALLKARHEDRAQINQPEVLIEVAQKCGLDVEKFKSDLDNREHLKAIERDHTELVEQHGGFGCPTFVFDNGAAAFLKIFIPPEDESVEFFEEMISLMSRRSYLGEVKRPQPPWPKGVFGPRAE